MGNNKHEKAYNPAIQTFPNNILGFLAWLMAHAFYYGILVTRPG